MTTTHEWTLRFLRIGAWLLVSGCTGFLLWGGWDLILIKRGQLAGNSISQAAMRALFGWHPGVIIAITLCIGILIGVLLGHFGWPQIKEIFVERS